MLLIVAIVGLDNSVSSYSLKNDSFLSEELNDLWNFEEEAGKKLFLKRVEERLPLYKPIYIEASNTPLIEQDPSR